MKTRVMHWITFARVAGIALALALILWLWDLRAFYPAWLFALTVFSGVALGGLGLLLIGALGEGAWRRPARPVLRAAALTLPLLGIMAIPVVVGFAFAAPWATAEPAGIRRFPDYMSPLALLLRLVGYFVLWTGLALLVAAREPETPHRPLAVVGLVLYVPSVSLAVLDAIAVMEPGWQPSAAGLVFIASGALAALGLVAAVRPALDAEATDEGRSATRQLGALLIAALLIAAYLAFIQFLVVWWANLPEEAAWLLRRTNHVLDRTVIVLAVALAAVALAALLSEHVRSDAASLSPVGWIVLASYGAYRWWESVPAFAPPTPPWFTAVVLAIFGAVWVAAFQAALQRQSVVATRPGGRSMAS